MPSHSTEVAAVLACEHDSTPFGAPMCRHLRECREPWLSYVKWYVGSGLQAELICLQCAEEREGGVPTEIDRVCEECFDYATTEVGDLVGIRGKAGIRNRSEPFNNTLTETALPREIGKIVDIAPVNCQGRSVWLMLADDGQLIRVDANTLEWARVAFVNVPLESDHKPWNGRVLRRRLHCSGDGLFAAVVNDYGRHGEIIDLRRGKVTTALDGGEYFPTTVPFSFAFADLGGRTIAIHRTAWNRLDVSDPSTGELITQRGPTEYRFGEERPAHYLDYFHGALYVSPNDRHILDDGWVWHPVGISTVWSIERWVSENPWESEDGPSKKDICARDYYWDHGITWLDERRVAVGGIGNDDVEIIDGARIFDITLLGTGRWGDELRWALEIKAFPGPAGAFFSDGISLFSSDETGMSRWDTEDGSRTGQLENFRPTHYHRTAREFVQLINNTLVRWSSLA